MVFSFVGGATLAGVKTQDFDEGAALGGVKTQSFDSYGRGLITQSRKIFEKHCSTGGGRGNYFDLDGDVPASVAISL